jgi:AcrR family transcriptional regulator
MFKNLVTPVSLPRSSIELPKKPKKRNAEETRERLLNAATLEFCECGYAGARIERIAKNACCNIRMAYHYFEDKEGLYLAVLERVYSELRQKEKELDLENLDPASGMRRLIEFTFDHMGAHPEFISLVLNENLLSGRMLRKSSKVVHATTPLVGMIKNTLGRGEEAGVFRHAVDSMQLYVSILSLCFVHISNRYTLSIIFEKDLGDPQWLRERRVHAVDVIMSYLKKN